MSLHLVPDAPNWLFSACSFIAGVLVLIPFPWHLEGTSLFHLFTMFSILTLEFQPGTQEPAYIWAGLV
jgi:hypothetical protein